MKPSQVLLSIAIPAYDRPAELLHGLRTFIRQIEGRFESEVEILVSDDCSPQDSLSEARRLANEYSFISYQRYSSNVGLEQNLLMSTRHCKGEYLWIFGDDDFLEFDGALEEILSYLRRGEFDFFILNRTRRSFDLSQLLSKNWMNLNPESMQAYDGLRRFCLDHGFISVIGFISVNIFRRSMFQQVDFTKYLGTMYPQLGAMLEAFYDKPTLLLGRPFVCHRTQTREEKRNALGRKKTESDFMADEKLRNAKYFGHPYVAMLAELLRLGAFQREDISKIPENTVINGLLVDFLINTMDLVNKYCVPVSRKQFETSKNFFAGLILSENQRIVVERIFDVMKKELKPDEGMLSQSQPPLTISVVTPSFNQARFLVSCLDSVKEQSYQPIEHLVYDPGSTDGSLEIARQYPGVTLINEPDSGQSDALNKGFARAQGDIIAWLNSDDAYANPHVFEAMAELFSKPDAPEIIYGRGEFVDQDGNKLRDAYVNKDPDSLPWRFQQEDGILQPALFMRKSVIEKVGMLRNDRHYCMDYEYWIRCVKAGVTFEYVDMLVARAAFHVDNKTFGSRGESYADVCDMLREQFGYVNHVWLQRYAEYLSEGYDGVLDNADKSGIRNRGEYQHFYRQLLRDFNTAHDVYTLLEEKSSSKGYGDTLRVMQQEDISPEVPCNEVDLEVKYLANRVLYTVGKRRWSFDAAWKKTQIEKSHAFLRHQIRERKSDTCVIVGNGPSLNKIDFELLEGQDVIMSNNVFLSPELIKHATYYTVVNYLVAEQSSQHINSLIGVNKVLPYWMAYCLNPGENTYFVDAVGHAAFSTDIFKNMSWRHTVTFFNLHLAYGLGYSRVVLIGFDHNYIQPSGIKEQEVIQSYEEDSNHFHPDYFRGKKWQAADERMMESMYMLAKTAYDDDDREIINATVGGKLELFPRMELSEALNLRNHACSANAASKANSIGAHDPEAKDAGIRLGPYARKQHAHWDETKGIERLFRSHLRGSFMIDVGAHHGWALAPFLGAGWEIYALEPDQKNRNALEARLKNHPFRASVTVDSRCVSNNTRQGVPFYSSEQSSGISGLSAFHESHKEVQRVDVTTLREVLDEREAAEIDFLKIDTEGHDLFVLQGYPWERGRPRVIECEFEDAKTESLGYSFDDLARYLVNKGYTVFVSEWHPIVRYGIRHDWRQLARYPCQLADPKGWGNLLAFLEPINEKVLLDAVTAELQLDGVPYSERVTSLRPQVEKISFNGANRLAQSRNFEEALQQYLDLYARNPFHIYEDNAVWAAQKIGLKQVKSAEDFERDGSGKWCAKSVI